MFNRSKCAFILGLFVLFFAFSPNADAGVPVFYHYGEELTEVGDVAEAFQDEMSASFGGPAKVGYIYEAFGLFWLDIWSWNGRFCVYRGESYAEIDAEQAAELLGLDSGAAKKPFWYRFPPGLLALVVIFVGFIAFKVIEARQESTLEALFTDERYRRALEIFSERVQGSEGQEAENAGQQAFEEAVAYLHGQGIDPGEARENLATMVNAIIAQQQDEATT